MLEHYAAFSWWKDDGVMLFSTKNHVKMVILIGLRGNMPRYIPKNHIILY